MKNWGTNLCTIYDLLIFNSSLISVVSVKYWRSIFSLCILVRLFLHCRIPCTLWMLIVFLFQLEYDLYTRLDSMQSDIISCALESCPLFPFSIFLRCPYFSLQLFPPDVSFFVVGGEIYPSILKVIHIGTLISTIVDFNYILVLYSCTLILNSLYSFHALLSSSDVVFSSHIQIYNLYLITIQNYLLYTQRLHLHIPNT